MGGFVRHAAMIFAPVRRLISHGAHTPALRGKRNPPAPQPYIRQALFALVVFIDEFEFVLAKMEVL
jgi:hypothetical protein